MANIILEKRGPIGLITINRPEAMNALDFETYDQFGSALQEVKNDSELRAIIITGKGKSFCAGLDLKAAVQIKALTKLESVRLIKRLQKYFTFEAIDKPVISAVNGHALGNGCDIALACDFVIASEKAKFSMAYTNIGLIPDMGGTFRLPRLVGLPMARRLIFTGETIDAPRALEIGMIEEVVSDDALRDRALAFAEQLAQRPPIALAMAKAAINKALSVDLLTALDFEVSQQMLCLQSEDAAEAMTAFAEKRAPEFTGR
jgi:enoyl-CoA hydratase